MFKKPFLSFHQKEMMQLPTDLPNPDDNTPIDFSNPADIIIYVVLPIICVILYFIWRNSRKPK